MKEKLQKIREHAMAEIENSDGLAKLNDVRVAVLGKKGELIEDFVERIEDYGEDDRLENIVDDITGNYNGSYNCSTFESARIIAENIFEFIALVDDIQMFNGTRFDITEVERNLVAVLDYICQNTILAQDCNTLGELINKLAE